MRFTLFILILLVGMLSCQKKEIPENTSNEPIFYFRGYIGTDSFDLTAGKNDIYMYTDFFKDTQSLTTLIGYFAPVQCNTCEPYLSFELKDVDTSNASILTNGVQGLFSGGGVFNSYSLDSVATNINFEEFTFTPDTPGGTHLWRFGDGSTSTLANPSHTYSSGGIKSVTHIHTRNGYTDSITNNIDIDKPCNRPQFTYSYNLFTSNYYFVSNQSSASSVFWDFGNGSTSNSINDSTIYSNSNKYLVKLKAIQGATCGNDSASFRKIIYQIGTGGSQYANPNFNYQTTMQNITKYLPRINSNAFIITWKNNGKIYKSYKNLKTINQSNNPVFTATSFGLYENNEKGMKTLKVHGTLNTYLYNQANPNDSILIRSNQVVVGAAYP